MGVWGKAPSEEDVVSLPGLFRGMDPLELAQALALVLFLLPSLEPFPFFAVFTTVHHVHVEIYLDRHEPHVVIFPPR